MVAWLGLGQEGPVGEDVAAGLRGCLCLVASGRPAGEPLAPKPGLDTSSPDKNLPL